MSMITPLKRVRGLGSAKEGAGHFLQQRLTAAANIILVPFAVGLFAKLAGADLGTVKATLSHPGIAIAVVVLILSVCVHMRIGMQIIIEDYVQDESTKLILVMANTFFTVAVALASAFAILMLSFKV